MRDFNTTIGTTLGQYRLERLLANGSRADVYQARDERLERPVALKVSHLPGSAAQFRAEARLTATLDHPNILPVYDFGEQAGIAYLVMHYAPGGSLHSRLNSASSKDGLPLEEIAYYLDQAAAALDYTHTKGIIHRNLKPANLLLRERWLMLADFGQALPAGKTPPAAAPDSPGTALYASPEQALGKPLGPAADLYALGIMLYQVLWGSMPPSDPASITRRAQESISPGLAKPLPPLAGLGPRQVEGAREVIMQATAPYPQDRYESAGALAAEFRALIAVPGGPGTSAEIPLICPTCGFLNKPRARFCRNDGTPLPIICPRCGAENRSDAKFCQSDGTELVRICPTCGTINPRQASTCQKDQTPLALVCPVCGFENSLRARFCERDGAQLVAGRASQAR